MKQHQSRLFPYVLALSFLFFVIQVSVYIAGGSDAQYVTYLIKQGQLHVPYNAFIPEIRYFLIQVGLYVFYALAIWGCARVVGHYLKLTWKQTSSFAFFLWLMASIAVIFLNQWFFPASILGGVLGNVIPRYLALSIAIASSAFCFYVLFLALYFLIRHYKRLSVLVFAIFTVGFTGNHVYSNRINRLHHQGTVSKPNIIFIGIDSLRPDYTGFSGWHQHADLTPHLNHFLKSATIFTQATTGLARTFPSWAVILTGEYSVHNGVRTNLADQLHLNFHNSLPNMLRRDGYTTMYATDERRFSNVGKRFGFDKLVGPREGVNDFVLGTINDLPLSNLLVNSRFGHWLFPYDSGNRAAYYNYDPETFNRIVERHLSDDRHHPIFLAIHFCLPHWPYAWSHQSYDTKLFPEGLYKRAVKREDEQVNQFIQFLKRKHFLDHAVVVVLSDHGESLLRDDDRMVSKKHYIKGPHSYKHVFKALTVMHRDGKPLFNKSYGHGTDVLSFVQYHTVLAVRFMGTSKHNHVGLIKPLVSLTDLEPTILDYLKLHPVKTDGISLMPALLGKKVTLDNRPVFTENGFTPDAFETTSVNVHGLLVAGHKLFTIEPNDKLILKPALVQNIVIPGKQRAVLYREWVLALYPRPYHSEVAVLVNRKTGQWTDDLTTSFAQHAPLNYLLNQLANLYGKEVTNAYPYRHNQG